MLSFTALGSLEFSSLLQGFCLFILIFFLQCYADQKHFLYLLCESYMYLHDQETKLSRCQFWLWYMQAG